MFFGPQSKAVHVDSFIRATRVGLVRLDPREIGTFTLRETVLSVELELGSDDGVLAPTVHVKGGLAQDERTGIRHGGAGLDLGSDRGRAGNNTIVVGIGEVGAAKVGLVVRVSGTVPVSSPVGGKVGIKGASVLEEAVGINETVLGSVSAVGTSDFGRASESVDSIGEGINGVGVVEGLGTENLEEEGVASKG